MVGHHRSAKLRNVVLEVHQVLALLVRDHIVEVNVLVAPLEVMNDALIRQLLLHDKDVLEEVDDALVDVKVIELGDHRLLIFQVSLILVNQSIPLIDHASNVVKDLRVHGSLQASQRVVKRLVFSLLSVQLGVHSLDLLVVPVELANDHLFVLSVLELGLDLLEVAHDFGQLVRVGLLSARLVQQLLCLVPQLVNLVVEHVEHGLEICLFQLIDVDHVVVSVLADGTSEADAHGAVLAEALHGLVAVLIAPVGQLGPRL